MVQVIYNKNTATGVWGAWAVNEDVAEITPLDSLTPNNFKEVYDGHDETYILDLPVDKGTKKVLDPFDPFDPFINKLLDKKITLISSYGEELEGAKNYIGDSFLGSPAADFRHLMIKEQGVYPSVEYSLLEGLHAYHIWDEDNWEDWKLGQKANLYFQHFGDTFINGKMGDYHLHNIEEEVDYSVLLHNQNEYIEKKMETAETMFLNNLTGSPVPVSIVYAENHPNELAHAIMDKQGSYENKVCLVATHAGRNDKVSIRTRGGIHAGKLANAIYGGKGKEHTAVVYLPAINNSMIEAIFNTVSEIKEVVRP